MSIVDRIDPAFGNWLAGFTDGEGCFYIGRIVTRKPTGIEYVNYRCAFSISLREDDRQVIDEIRARLGFGRIVERGPRNFGSYKSVAGMVALEVGDKAGTQSLVEIFDAYPLRAKKARDFALWKLAVADWASRTRGGGRHRGSHDWALMEQLHGQVKGSRKFLPPE